MTNHIQSATVNVQQGLLVGTIAFDAGLNLISGENGTLKTKLLQAIKNEALLQLQIVGAQCRRQAVSPKRNAQRRAFHQIVDQFRRNNTKLEGLTNERNINDAAFEEYPALGDLFYVVYEDLCKDGGDRIERMKTAATDFNHVIQQIFPHYELIAEWNNDAGTPSITLEKNKKTRVPLEGLSLGEQEILSLAMNIYSSRGRYEVFLIDEPEVHLNWHLEERLFDFLDNFCTSHKRQLIVVTHSRVIFKQRFYGKTKFLHWNNEGTVSVAKEVTPEQRRRIAGDAIEIVRMGKLTKPTFFVEDSCHALIVEDLARFLTVDVAISECGTKSNLRSLFMYSQSDGGWSHSYFLEDGDNEGNPHPGDKSFLHLDKYCLESYLLDAETAAQVCGVTSKVIRGHLLKAIVENKDKIFRKNKFFQFLLAHLSEEHLTTDNIALLDASEIIHTFLGLVGKDFREYVREYISCAKNQGRLLEVMPAPLVNAMTAAPKQDGDTT